MGRLVDGHWHASDTTISNGQYIRQFNIISNTDALSAELSQARDRSRLLLILSHSCPWSHRTALVRALKKLDDLPVHYAHGLRLEGYALNGGAPLSVPGVEEPLVHLHELYTRHDPSYTGRATVPVLWDGVQRRILSNESLHLMRALDRMSGRTSIAFTLYPEALDAEVSGWSKWLYENLNNAVYRAGFAKSQDAYDDAEASVFNALARLDVHLSRHRFLCGAVLTGADLQALPTLVRFDRIYHILFRCTRRRLTEHAHVWSYARDLYALPGVAETVDWDAMARASYAADDAAGQNGIVPRPPAADWSEPAGRGALAAGVVLDDVNHAHPLGRAIGA